MPFKKGNNYGYSGASPSRSRGTHHGWMSSVVYTVEDGEIKGTPVWQRQQKETEKSVSINRYKYKAIDELFKISGYDDADFFWEDFEKDLDKICLEMSKIATNTLRRLIATMAYTTTKISEKNNKPVYDYDSVGIIQFQQNPAEAYTPTGEFIKAWVVVVSITDSMRSLRFNVVYDYDAMTVSPPPYAHYFPIHESFGGQDYRRALADILNESWSFWRDNGDEPRHVTRPGGWQEIFDGYCHNEFYTIFLDKCRKAGMIDD